MNHINLFQTNAEFLSAYNGSDYVEPWLSYTMETSGMSYNKGQTPPPHDYSQDYLTLVMLTSGSIETHEDNIEFSVDGGETWATELNNLQEGDNVLIRGHYTQGQSGCPWGMTGSCNAQGNILSLYDADNFRNRTSLNEDTERLGGVFYEVDLFSAENLVLPLTALTPNCYSYMFASCTNLTSIPELPATTLAEGCYGSMFYNCTSLTTAPELPATTLAGHCYHNMFGYCTSLTTVPELPATTLAESCYDSMFYGCSSLVIAPALLATTLAESCCDSMFSDCTSLTTAPALLATTLVKSCYYYMFYHCNNLNYVKCLATDKSARNCTDGWLYDVASTGTFVKAASMTDWPSGESGIPNGWTVEDAS